MGQRVRLFIDFWNFTLAWSERAGEARCDWTKVPVEFRAAASAALAKAGLGDLDLVETRIYASYEPGTEAGRRLKHWLHNFLDRQPGVCVFAAERHWRERAVHCRACDHETVRCQCGAPFGRAVEKTVDARIVTDMMGLAWEGSYDVALLVTSDADFIPAVETLQTKNHRVVNATWRGHGHELAAKSWASFEIDPLVPRLVRPSR
jgi:uncharacterized LabA/DUF88 family protein